MSGPLWHKEQPTDACMHRLTVGDDPVLDQQLVPFDCMGSAAHGRMLSKIGLLSTDEAERLIRGLRDIRDAHREGRFVIRDEEEDCHTAIENALVRDLGEVGRKIHAGRSRNDQVLAAIRLYLRERTVAWLEALCLHARTLLEKYDLWVHLPMPGYTHLQPAMPSSLGLWTHAFVEGCLDLLRQGLRLLDSLDECPLGSAAGFGVPVPLDRPLTARLLGFSRVQRSVLDTQNARGRHEARFLAWASEIAALLEKLACDLSLFLTREFGFLSLPTELTTGSSIMPQKRNPDLVELLRARAAVVRAAVMELNLVVAKLPSGYHRDFQLTKRPLLRAVRETEEMLEMSILLLNGIRPDEQRLRDAMSPELYVTYEAYRLLQQGMPFRDAYREAARRYSEGVMDVTALASAFERVRSASEQEVHEARAELCEQEAAVAEWAARLGKVEREVMGDEV